MTFVLRSLSVNITKCKVWNKNKYSGDHSLSRVVVPATLHSISVNVHFTRFLGSGHANLLSKYRTHPTENIWKETSVEGKYREANDGEYQGRIQDSKLGGALKKIAPSGGRRENFGGISCENSRFYAKKADYRISLLPLTSNSKNKTVVSKLHCMSNL